MTYQPGVYREMGGNRLVVRCDVGFLAFGDGTVADPNAILLGGGTNTHPITSATTKNFADFRTKNSAAAGDLRGLYWRHELSGGASGEAGRFVGYVSSASGPSSAHGMHNTLAIAAAGKISGLGVGVRATLEVEASGNPGGTLAALQVDGYIGSGATLPGPTSLIRLAKSGSVDIPYLFDISDDQCLKGSAAGATNNAIKCRLPNGSDAYIPLCPVS